MKNDGVFQIKFEDGTKFVGNLFKRNWREIPDKKRIKDIMFSFGDKHVKMENFREYNLTFETHVKIGENPRIVNITLAGRSDNSSVLIIYDWVTGKVLRKEVEKYREYEWICSTWRKGVNMGEPHDYHR